MISWICSDELVLHGILFLLPPPWPQAAKSVPAAWGENTNCAFLKAKKLKWLKMSSLRLGISLISLCPPFSFCPTVKFFFNIEKLLGIFRKSLFPYSVFHCSVKRIILIASSFSFRFAHFFVSFLLYKLSVWAVANKPRSDKSKVHLLKWGTGLFF